MNPCSLLLAALAAAPVAVAAAPAGAVDAPAIDQLAVWRDVHVASAVCPPADAPALLSHETAGSFVERANLSCRDRDRRGGGRAVQSSFVGRRGASATLLASAHGDGEPGAQLAGDGAAGASLALHFRVRARVRYVLAATVAAGADLGYGEAEGEVLLRRAGERLYHIAVNPDETAQAAADGWLDAGDYRLEAGAWAEVDADPAAPRRNDASVWLRFRVHCAADADVDGRVDRRDGDAFAEAWLSGAASADVDGDGSVNAADRRAFARAFAQGC